MSLFRKKEDSALPETALQKNATPEKILSMRGIFKEYTMGDETSVVLKGIDLDVYSGDFLAILGPSGSGKSTLMNIIGCLDTPTAGEYYLSGRHIANLDEKQLAAIRSREIGFIFQSFHLLQRQTALENVELPLIYANLPHKQRIERAREMLCRVGLEDKLNHYPNQMSGGQQQRVAIARAIATNPTILLADEPTGALDQKTGAQVMEIFNQLNSEGRTIIMITHDAKIARHAKRIVRILDGNLSEGGVEDA
jgi:putative ABC transport system ATP-binding protein